MTNSHRVKFTVKDAYDDVPPRLVLEPCAGDIPFMKEGVVSLLLLPGLNDDDARNLAKQLNDAVEHLSFSKW